MNILMVCTGNTCRSPMAAGLLRAALPPDGFEVLSGGIYAAADTAATPHAVTAAEELGADISGHRAASLNPAVVEQADVILAMTDAHVAHLCALYPAAQGKTFSLGKYAGDNTQVQDPFGGDLDSYRRCAAQLQTLIQGAAQRLIREQTP